MIRPILRAVLFLACAAPCGAGLAACGAADAGPDVAAASTIRQTFTQSAAKLDSGHVDASFTLEPEGLAALGGPITFRAAGPFAAAAGDKLPRLDLAIAGSIAGRALHARAISTGKRAFLTLDGRAYSVDAGFVDALLGRARAGSKRHRRAGIASLGLDPRAWIKNPQTKGEETIAGVPTTHVAGTIDVPRLLADVGALLGGGSATSSLLPQKLRERIDGAVKATQVDVWTGARDRILRQLAVVVAFAFKTGQSPVAGLDGGKITLRLRLDGVNATDVNPVAPANARPLQSLMGDGGLGAFLSGLGAGVLGGRGDGGRALLNCVTAAGDRTGDVVACASKLAPTP